MKRSRNNSEKGGYSQIVGNAIDEVRLVMIGNAAVFMCDGG